MMMTRYLFIACFILLLSIPQVTNGQIVKKSRSGLSLDIYLEEWQTAERRGDSVLIRSLDRPIQVFVQGQDGIRKIYVKHNANTGRGDVVCRHVDIPGLGGKVHGYKFSSLPYARVWIIVGKDTTKLTCDALGIFHWNPPRVPSEYKIWMMAEGFETRELSTKFYQYQDFPGNWLHIQPRRIMKEELNSVTIFANKVQFIIQGDTVEYKVANAFKNLDGDWAGDLLRKLPGVSMEDGVLTMNGKPIHMVGLDNWKRWGKIKHGVSIVLGNLKRERELQREQRKDE